MCVHMHTERELERKTHREKQRGDGIMEETVNFRNVFYNASLDVFLRKHQYGLDAVLDQCGVQAITEQPWVLIIGMHRPGCLWGRKFTDRVTQHLPEARLRRSSWSTAEKGRRLRAKPPESKVPLLVGVLSHWPPCYLVVIKESTVSL